MFQSLKEYLKFSIFIWLLAFIVIIIIPNQPPAPKYIILWGPLLSFPLCGLIHLLCKALDWFIEL